MKKLPKLYKVITVGNYATEINSVNDFKPSKYGYWDYLEVRGLKNLLRALRKKNVTKFVDRKGNLITI